MLCNCQLRFHKNEMLIKEGKHSAQCFLLTFSSILLIVIDHFFLQSNVTLNFCFVSFYFVILTVYVRLKFNGILFQVGIRSIFLGAIFSYGVFIVLHASYMWKLFGTYMCVMSFFHYSEYLAIAWCNPKTLSISSFLLNHSSQYNLAAIASWLEFFLEAYFTPSLKNFPRLSLIGFALCVFGEVLRKCAMITGSTNFSHLVQTEKVDDHKLVTHGIYGLFRHPSYVGWFYWSIGTQMLLLNPICTVAYTVVSWRFFRERVIHEEHTLLYFFGRDYVDYQKSVGTGLPGIKGFLLDD